MKKTFLYAALAMMLAACSNDDTLQNGSAETDGMVPVTLSVAADNSIATSRADNNNGDPAPTRCFVQIFTTTDNGKTLTPAAGDLTDVQNMELNDADGTFSLNGIYLHPTTDYVFLFWADNGSGADPTDLREVSYTKGSIAFAKRKEWRYDGTNAAISEQLTHAVAKVTLKTTTDLAASSNISVALQHCYDTYDVSTGAVSGESSDKTFSTTVSTDITGSDDGTEVFSFYALTGEGTQEVSVKNGDNGDKASNVPLGPDKHTTLVGDVLYVGLTPVTFTASIDENWGSNETVNFPTHDINNDGDITIESGTHYIVGDGAETSNTITINGDAEVHLKGVNISASGSGINITDGSPTLVIEGENTVASTTATAVNVSGGATVTIEGKTGATDKLTATGGKTQGSGVPPGIGNPGAGIGTSDGGNIVIRNVTVDATGATASDYMGVDAFGAAAIGSANGNCGNITIQNAIINARGGFFSPAIGLGCGLNSGTYTIGNILIESSTINAIGGSSASVIGFPYGMPGNGNFNNITINAGKIVLKTDNADYLSQLTLTSTTASGPNFRTAYKIGKGVYHTTYTTFHNATGNGDWEGVEVYVNNTLFTSSTDGIGE